MYNNMYKRQSSIIVIYNFLSHSNNVLKLKIYAFVCLTKQ